MHLADQWPQSGIHGLLHFGAGRTLVLNLVMQR